MSKTLNESAIKAADARARNGCDIDRIKMAARFTQILILEMFLARKYAIVFMPGAATLAAGMERPEIIASYKSRPGKLKPGTAENAGDHRLI